MMPYLIKTVSVVFLALSFIIVGDTAGKFLTQNGFSPFLVAWLRFALGAVLILPLSGLKLSELPKLINLGVFLRALLIVLAISSILTALKTEPIANVFGAFFISPIISFFLSALLLKEKITPLRTALLFLGFMGVLLVVKPGFNMNVGLLFAVLAGCFHGVFIVSTRWLAPHYRPRLLLISQLLIGAVLLAPFSIYLPHAAWNNFTLFMVVLSALGSACGNYLLVIASRTTPGSLMAPLIYTQLIAATFSTILCLGIGQIFTRLWA